MLDANSATGVQFQSSTKNQMILTFWEGQLNHSFGSGLPLDKQYAMWEVSVYLVYTKITPLLYIKELLK